MLARKTAANYLLFCVCLLGFYCLVEADVVSAFGLVAFGFSVSAGSSDFGAGPGSAADSEKRASLSGSGKGHLHLDR